MVRHILKAVKYDAGHPPDNAKWMLIDTNTGDVIGGSCPDYARTRAQMYRDCDTMWGSDAPWYGKRVHGGYSIEVS